MSITFPLQKYFFSGSYLIGVEVWPRKIEERGFEAELWGLVDGYVGVGGYLGWPDESVGMNMGVISFPRK